MICDVAKYQGAIDWDKLAPELDFVVIKASGKYANGADPYFARNVAGAVSHGVPFHVYHYLYCKTESEAKRDAALFYNTVKAQGHEPLFWALDCEKGWGIAKSKARTIAEAFEAELRRLAGKDIKVAVYIGHNVYTDYALDYSRYAYVWIPRYGEKNDGTIEGSIVPDFPCDIWQFTSHGRLPGISGNVDLDVLNGDKPMGFFVGTTEEKDGGGEMENKCTAAAVITEAKKWIGYLEKKSNKDLDSFTANAGSANYTRFGRDYVAATGDKSALPEQWCGEFVSMVFVYAFGLEAAKKLLCGPLYKYTPSGASSFKKAGRYIKRGGGSPQPGDVVFFYSSAKGRIGHTGIVEKVTSTKVYTIEGNTSGASGLVTNGGGVAQKSYKLTSTYLDGYGRPDYASVASGTDGVFALELGYRMLENGMTGDDVKEMQSGLVRLGYDLGRWGADGDFGDCTEEAVRKFQEDHTLEVDGQFGPKSLEAFKRALAELDAPVEQPKKVRIEGGNCYVRMAPNTSGKKLGVAHAGDELTYGGETSPDGWLLVEYDGQNAWVSGKYGKLVT